MANGRTIAVVLILALLVGLLFYRTTNFSNVTEAASSPTGCAAGNVLTAVAESVIGALTLTCTAIAAQNGLQLVGSCKLTAQSATVTCTTYSTPSGTSSTYAIPCYVTATGVVNHATCQVVYTEANTNTVTTLTLVTAVNLNTVYTAEDIIWVAPSTTITVSLQVTSGTFNIAGAIIRQS